jgi:hypothetical protein
MLKKRKSKISGEVQIFYTANISMISEINELSAKCNSISSTR